MVWMQPCPACGFEHPEGVVICPSTQHVIGTAVVAGRYRLDRLIAVGGIGAVYDARALHIDRRVAVKRLLPAFASDPEIVRRFQREARAAGRIEHPNVVEVLDFGVAEDGVPFLVMEFLDGETLAARIAQAPGQRLSLDEILPIALDILEALGHSHSRGIVHRDLKPENIFLARRPNGTTVVKLVDLGISKAVGSTSQSITQSGSALGTPHYMAPEQLRGDRDIDGRVDLYAMGVVLYRALSGAFPFDGRTFEQLVMRILEGTYVPLSSIVPGLPAGVSEAVAWALASDRDQRVPTAEALAASLAPFVPPRPLTPTPRPMTPLPPPALSPASGHGVADPSRPLTPGTVPAAPAGAGVVPGSGGAGGSLQTTAVMASAAARSLSPRHSFRLWLVGSIVALVVAAAAFTIYFVARADRQTVRHEPPPSGGLAASHFHPSAEQTDAGSRTPPPQADVIPPPADLDAAAKRDVGTDAAHPARPHLHDAVRTHREVTSGRVPVVDAHRVSTEVITEPALVKETPEEDAVNQPLPAELPSAADAARLFRQAESAVHDCAAGQGPGSYRVVVVVRGSDGRVTGAHVVSELSEESVQCVRRVLTDLSFPPFGQGTSSFPWVFNVPGPAPAETGTAVPGGVESIEDRVRRILSGARRRALACVAHSTGPITLVVVIDGAAQRAVLQRVIGSVTAEEEACLREVVQTTEVPREISEVAPGIPFTLQLR